MDGRVSPDLEAAITQFQRNIRTNPSGRIDAMGPDMQAIDRSLPQDRKGMAVVENCSAVLCTSLPSHQGQEAQRVVRERTLLPREAANQLAEFIRNVQAQMGLTLRPDGHAIDHQGRMIQKLAFADVHWMNSQGQFSQQVPEDKAREVVASLQRRSLPSALEWHTGPMPTGQAAAVQNQRVGNTPSSMGSRPFGNAVLAVRTKQQLRCLCGPPKQVDEQRLRRLGLNLTGDAVIDRLQDVAATREIISTPAVTMVASPSMITAKAVIALMKSNIRHSPLAEVVGLSGRTCISRAIGTTRAASAHDPFGSNVSAPNDRLHSIAAFSTTDTNSAWRDTPSFD